MRYVTGALAIVALVAIAIFSIQNLEAVEVSFLAWSIDISKFLVIIGTYLLGMITGWGLVDLLKRFFQERRSSAKDQ
jgi:lipopolysaccharide assembly protein A